MPGLLMEVPYLVWYCALGCQVMARAMAQLRVRSTAAWAG